MIADSRKLLQFDELLQIVDGYVLSPLGKERLASVGPLGDREALAHRQKLIAESREYLRAGAPHSLGEPFAGAARRTMPIRFGDFTDPGQLVAKAAIEGAVLEAIEIAEVAAFAERSGEIKLALSSSGARFPALESEAAKIADFRPLVREIAGKILPTGELDDHASPELRRIRRDMERQRNVILSSLKSFLRTVQEDASPQDEIVTIRGERFVIPIPASRKSRAPGVVHGASNTGQTVYVEPLETIELNNDLVRLREQEHREIQIILARMTATIRERAADLAAATEQIGLLDFVFGCGKFSIDYDCIMPAISPEDEPARLKLKDARHPLLESLLRRRRERVQPLSLTLDRDWRVLVISGPNTGGKTVALKTVGLLAMMATSGLPVPAAEAEFPLFGRILADIGDYQSIQESLSTFSAHLMNIGSMMKIAGPSSLILLDELGSATDPDEAGALGVAVVEEFRRAGAFALASTHHMLVKAYSTNTPGVVSAHMGFDEQTLQPTYRLEVGLPGKSSGLAIARRLGFPAPVLDRATAAMSVAHLEVEQFLVRLKEREAAARTLTESLEGRLAAFEERDRSWHEDVRKREERRTAEWERQLQQLLREFEQRTEDKLKEIAARAPVPSRRAADPKREAARIAGQLQDETRDELRQATVAHLGAEGEKAPEEILTGPQPVLNPVAGERVLVKGFSQTGIVRRRDGNSVQVEIGLMRTTVPISDLLQAAGSGIASALAGRVSFGTSVSVQRDHRSERSVSEINVIGESAEDALSRVDKFLDDAFLAQKPRVRVVHGSGKGILRRALAEMFASHPHVEKYTPAPQNEGGAGATIVELRV